MNITNTVWADPATIDGSVLNVDKDEWQLDAVTVATGRERRLELPRTAVKIPAVGESQRSGWVYNGAPAVAPGGQIEIGRKYFDATDNSTSRSELVALRIGSSSMTARVLAPILAPFDASVSTAFAWNDDRSEAYATLTTGSGDGCTTVIRFSHGRWRPIDLRVGDAATGWNLGDAAGTMAGDGCSATVGTARVSPVVPSAQQTVAFFATPTPVGHPSVPGVQNFGNIYSTRFGSDAADVLVGDLVAGPFAMSPDGHQLAWSGKPRGTKWGLWILDIDSGRSTRISDGIFEDVSWSPDGRSLAGLDSLEHALTVFDKPS